MAGSLLILEPLRELCPLLLGVGVPLMTVRSATTTCSGPLGQSQRGIYSPGATIGRVGFVYILSIRHVFVRLL